MRRRRDEVLALSPYVSRIQEGDTRDMIIHGVAPTLCLNSGESGRECVTHGVT